MNAFTVDVEDYYQVSAFERQVRRDDWGGYESRVAASTRRLLGLLARHETRATFFVLGWVADRCPELVREIYSAGHELASHGFWHRLVYEQTPDEFRHDIRAGRKAVEDAAGVRVTAYRAPSFSITRRSLWALDVLAEEGFEIDSSIYPVRHDRYGIPGAAAGPHQIDTAAGPIWEFPPSVVRIGRASLPVSGGGYFRLYPLAVTFAALRQINRRGRPFMFYVHPWEIDPGQPRLSAGSRLSRFRHRVNLRSTEQKLDRLLGRLPFGTLSEALADAQLALDTWQLATPPTS